MRAVITVIGKDTVGILAKVSSLCAQHQINVTDVSQSILQDLFVMVMLVDLSNAKVEIDPLAKQLEALGSELGLTIRIMHEDLFQSMHRI